MASGRTAYAARRPTQGRDVAYCYGAYSFEMPWGDVVTGVVLEDLSRTAESIADFCKREKRNLSSVEDAYNVLSSSFRHLHRLHSLDVGHVQPRLDNILVLRESTSTEVQFVFCGFSWAESAAEGRRALRATEPDQLYRWGDECLLDGIWSLVLEWSVYVEWGEYAEEHEPGLVAWGGQRTEADDDSE
ncbi:hypothetical protein DMC30DRAFT_424264 [Rhodotorula diobovata]|uniref:Protein kinase domain-containing protein n=1 Tax=Rhodotorula diobovata TaxID=5288 RepID=A0A5C5FR11_9BASI|nr:hypothetical protein DMC30DRAFT_424264 [Rhodotorula diobovata]